MAEKDKPSNLHIQQQDDVILHKIVTWYIYMALYLTLWMRQNFLDFLLSPKDLYCVLRTNEPKDALEHGKLCKSIVNKLCPNWIVLHSVALNCNKVHHTHIFLR